MTCLGWSASGGVPLDPLPQVTRGERRPAAEALPRYITMETTEFVVAGCGPAGGIAAREAARAKVSTPAAQTRLAPTTLSRSSGTRKRVRTRALFLALGSTARLDEGPFGYAPWSAGLITCYQYRVYLERPAIAPAYQTLEMHYFRSASNRPVIAWMFPKRDHLAIGLGIQGKLAGDELRATLDAFVPSVAARLFAGIAYTVRTEGALLYGGKPRPIIADEHVMVGGTAAGLIDATTGEGIHEAASSGRFAACAVALARHRALPSPGPTYARAVKQAFYSRLHHRQTLMTFLEARPARFDVLFEQLAGTPRFADLLQRDRAAIGVRDRLYLYAQAMRFGARALFVA